MAKGILARKLGMTRIFDDEGRSVPVTILRAGPCAVVQVKTVDNDDYSAVQLGFEEIQPKRLGRAERGHFEKRKMAPHRIIQEFRDVEPAMEIGTVVNAGIFEVGESVRISGISKGKGFQGGMKRHGFHGGRASHGSKFHREIGSLNSSAYPSRVFKGKKMPGRMGSDKITLTKVKVMGIDVEKNIILIKGPVPGSISSLVRIEAKKL